MVETARLAGVSELDQTVRGAGAAQTDPGESTLLDGPRCVLEIEDDCADEVALFIRPESGKPRFGFSRQPL